MRTHSTKIASEPGASAVRAVVPDGTVAPPAPGAPTRAAVTPVGVGVLGATGYTGAELVRILSAHPGSALRALTSRQHSGEKMSRVWPSMPHLDLVLEDEATAPRQWRDRDVQVLFAALPHGAFEARAAAYLEAGMRVIDLSADFRPRFAPMLGADPASEDVRAAAVYGLTEWCGPELDSARIVANPGCYATAVLLGSLPAVASGLWSGAPIVVNALSGVSGAGRAPALGTHFVECGNGAAPYRVGEEHAHLAEMLETIRIVGTSRKALDATAGSAGASLEGSMIFNPHLVPMARGIVASIAMPLARRLDVAEARELYAARYAGCPFVQLLEGEALPETRHVRGSNRCDLALRVVAGGRMLLVFSALDNLQKGAAGQAVQNWNRMQGWPEETGLSQAAWPCV